jgi:hypothetical protein
VNEFAQQIRWLNGSNKMGAGALAEKLLEWLRARADGVQEVPERGNTTCNPHPDAQHGFNRNASHSAGRYVCDCEGWMPAGVEGCKP